MSVDVASLQAQIAALQIQVAQLTPPAPPPPYAPAPAPLEVRPTAIYKLVGNPAHGYLHRDPREVRRMIEAVALAKGAVSPGQTVPPDWGVPLRRVAAARAGGLSWRESLTEAGVEAPDDLDTPALAVRAELDDLWDRTRAITGFTLDNANDVVKDQLKTFLRRALA